MSVTLLNSVAFNSVTRSKHQFVDPVKFVMKVQSADTQAIAEMFSVSKRGYCDR